MHESSRFVDRRSAGRELARQLRQYAGRDDVVVLALPRGGVPVGAELAKTLRVPWSAFLVRKLGTPGRRELAMGAIASGGVRILNDAVIRGFDVRAAEVDAIERAERAALLRGEAGYPRRYRAAQLAGRVAILVDEGVATGMTMRAAVHGVTAQRVSRVVVALPVAARSVCEALSRIADEVTCARPRDHISAVSHHYENFPPVTDEEVRALMEEDPSRP